VGEVYTSPAHAAARGGSGIGLGLAERDAPTTLARGADIEALGVADAATTLTSRADF
jgi:hypothetical protein